MILTGQQSQKEHKNGNLIIEPFNEKSINPNSYNYRLGEKLKIFKEMRKDKQIFEEIIIPESGYI